MLDGEKCNKNLSLRAVGRVNIYSCAEGIGKIFAPKSRVRESNKNERSDLKSSSLKPDENFDSRVCVVTTECV